MTDIVIAEGCRTAFGRFNGSFANVPAPLLGTTAAKEAMKRAKTEPGEVESVVFGIVLSGNVGGNAARQVCINSGVPETSPAYSINQLCASGMRAVAEAYKSVKLGEASIVLAGGMENMTGAPHEANLRSGTKMGDFKMVDSMLRDGLIDVFHNYHMGVTAENLAKKYQITREQQDTFAAQSQARALAATEAGRFREEIVDVMIKDRKGEKAINIDEHITAGTTFESLAKLRPAFDKEGTVTAGNASGINDGAAAVVVMTADQAKKRGVEPLGRIVSWATTGCDPSIMGIGPVTASEKALKLAGWTADDLDLIELNEAFAAQSLSVLRQLGWENKQDIINVNGGAIALGHPIGCSGARILVTLLYEMRRRGLKKGLATLCVGGGMGIAMCMQRD
jgi:acetyl-CoA C-acetyltransferase